MGFSDFQIDVPSGGGTSLRSAEHHLVTAKDRLSELIVPLLGESPAARLRLSLQMADDGIRMMRQNLHRKFPRASEEEIDQHLAEWLQGPDEADGVWLRSAPERLAGL